MKRIKKIISVILTVSVLISAVAVNFSLNTAAATTQTAYINGDTVNVRKGAGTNYGKITQISYRQVTVLSKNGDWLNIKFMQDGSEIIGWIKYDSSYVYIDTNDPDLDFNTQLTKFPESYRAALTALHSKYPNWKFVPDNVNATFDASVELQMAEMRKQVQTSQPISWRSMGKGAYDWSTGKWIETNGGWVAASREAIRYYMDPRNFLNEDYVYMFLMQSYGNVSYTAEGVKSIVSGTFLNTDEYINIILNAGKTAGISPYIIASKIIQEQGSAGTSSLISGTYSGYEGYYNFFNWNASGSNETAVIQNGLKYAKGQGWSTKEKAIAGGAKLLADGYIEVGQDTYYYQDFNVHFTGKLWHQYAQAVHDAASKGTSLKKNYGDKYNYTLYFRIPVFKNMPSANCVKPVENDGLNNYYLNGITVSGLTPTFYRYTYKYDLNVTGDTMADVSVPDKATLTSASEFSLNKGSNTVTLTVKSQTGYTSSYTIAVNATTACKLYINKASSGSGGTASSVKLGDINSDGNITVSDMATIRLHLLSKYTLSGNAFTSADINKDGKITVSDMATVRLHLLGKYTIS